MDAWRGGRPSTGWVAQIMRHTRAQYHFAIKRSRSQNEQIKKFKVMLALFSSDRDFFKEVRKILEHAKSEIPSMDGINDNGQIADIFAKQYKELFNSNKLNPEDLRAMMERLCTNIRTDPNSVIDCCVTLEDIKDVIKRLKREKQDGVYNNMASEHFINVPDSFYEYLCLLFSKCLLHRYMPSAMVLSTLILLVLPLSLPDL